MICWIIPILEDPMKEEYFTVKEVAQQLKVSRQAIYEWINAGSLRAVKAGNRTRIPASALNDFLRPMVPKKRDSMEEK